MTARKASRKRLSTKRIKNKAWNIFSQYIRRKYADKKGYVKCCTCGTVRPWKEMQAGHFIDGRNNSVLFDERLVFPQCIACNVFLHGNKIKYTLFMLNHGYSTEDINQFELLKFVVKKMCYSDYQDIIEKYSDMLCGLDVTSQS